MDDEEEEEEEEVKETGSSAREIHSARFRETKYRILGSTFYPHFVFATQPRNCTN